MARYLNNNDMYNHICEYKKNKTRSSYEHLGKMILLIATKAINMHRFISYTDDRKSEMVSDACFMMLKKIEKFDETKYTNPLAYFTEMAKNAYKACADGYRRRDKVFTNLSFIENYEKGESS